MDSLLFEVKSDYTAWLIDHYHWAWPACETLHFMGMALLVGIVGLVDLRLLGVARSLPFAPLQRLLPLAILGFVINLITGVVFVTAAPGNYATSIAFRLKVLFILLAGINVLAFYLTGASRAAAALGPGDDAPLPVKSIAAISLFLWIGVMFWGLMLPFLLLGSSNAE